MCITIHTYILYIIHTYTLYITIQIACTYPYKLYLHLQTVHSNTYSHLEHILT